MDIEQVTTPTNKTKAPGRVAWGKKLAEVRRQQKLKSTTQVEKQTTNSATHTEDSTISTQTLIGIGCLTLGAGALYYQYRTYQSQALQKDDTPLPQPKDDKPAQSPTPSSKSRLANMM